MRRTESSPRGAIPFGTFSSRGDQELAGFEELAMPLSHSLYNFARWLAHDGHDAEDLMLKVSELLANCGLRDVKLAASFAESSKVSDGAEVA